MQNYYDIQSLPTMPERALQPEDVYGDMSFFINEPVHFEDLESEEQAELAYKYNTADPDLFLEAVAESDDYEEFFDCVLNANKTIGLMDLETIKSHNKSHYQALRNLQEICHRILIPYAQDQIQENLLDSVEDNVLGFTAGDISHKAIMNIRNRRNRQVLGGVA